MAGPVLLLYLISLILAKVIARTRRRERERPDDSP
jgi:Sec-independent protein secretion pathway component TatC